MCRPMHHPADENGHSRDIALREMEAEIARTRERLVDSIAALKYEITTLSDWRSWIRRRPLPFLGGAFLLGLSIGLILPTPHSR